LQHQLQHEDRNASGRAVAQNRRPEGKLAPYPDGQAQIDRPATRGGFELAQKVTEI
jgi:hypothetical protein